MTTHIIDITNQIFFVSIILIVFGTLILSAIHIKAIKTLREMQKGTYRQITNKNVFQKVMRLITKEYITRINPETFDSPLDKMFVIAFGLAGAISIISYLIFFLA